ncbi:MAG: hypothetical protein P3T54_02670 [Dehalogenimonas sp.]|uniref:DUF3153 domain-containing protein n=1 Tax=Candidatus Dehalogenimonas loeffleri TaxID=3127115 RepID=A0ABZ2J510_9CHLR|nr:hypothetical protein [Dehalogenimonas sp.]
MLKHKLSKTLITAMTAGLILLAGCGTLDMQLETDVKASGDYTQKVVINATGAIGASLVTEGGADELTGDGWQVSQTQSGDTVTLTASKDFSPDDPFFLPDATGTETASPVLDIQRQNSFLFTDYSFTVNIPSDPEGMGFDGGDELDMLAPSLLKNMFSISWTVNMPGKITAANADIINGSSATWNFDVVSMSEGVVMTADVRVINWAIISGLAAFAIIIAILSLIFVRRRR